MSSAQETQETPQLASACRVAAKVEKKGAKQPEPDDKHMLQALKDVAAERQETGPHKFVFGVTNVVLYKCGCGVFTEEEYNTPTVNYRDYKDRVQDLVTHGKATRAGWLRSTEFRCDGVRVLQGTDEYIGRLGKRAFEAVEWTEKRLGTKHDDLSDFQQTFEMWMTVPVIPGCEEESWRLRVEAAFSNSGLDEKLDTLKRQRNGYQARIDHDAYLSYANLCFGIKVDGVNTSWARSMDEKTACIARKGGAIVLHGNSYCVRMMELQELEGQPEMVRVCTDHLDSLHVEDSWLVIGGGKPIEETRTNSW